jgi:hypothetical protein
MTENAAELEKALLLIEKLMQALSYADKPVSHLTQAAVAEAELFLMERGRSVNQPLFTW